jgi:lysophospholipid acyltransferase (LPLAT)-like uncharacterized protein
MMKRVLQSRAAQVAAAWVLGHYLRWTLASTSWTLIGEDHVAPYAAGRPCVAAFWHERLPLMPALWQVARTRGARKAMHVMVSRHRDGHFIGEIIRYSGIHVVHGSSARRGEQRGGAGAVRALLALLAQGNQVAITPDGPRGPRRQAAAGVAQIAAIGDVPVLPCAAQTSRRRVLRSWDRMVIPLPFGRGVIVCGEPLFVPRRGWEASLPAIQAALDAAVAEADRACAA